MCRSKLVLCSLLFSALTMSIYTPISAVQSGIMDTQNTDKVIGCDVDAVATMEEQAKFFCDNLGLNYKDYLTVTEDGAEIKDYFELQDMYLEKNGYGPSKEVVEDGDTVTYKYTKYSFKAKEVIETESCYSKEKIEHLGEDGNWSIKPDYSVNYNGCRMHDGLTVLLNDESALDDAVAAANRTLEKCSMKKFTIDSNVPDADGNVLSYYYKDGKCIYTEKYRVDDNGTHFCDTFGPNGEILTENQKDEILYDYMDLDLMESKKHLLDSIYYQLKKSSMSLEDALAKYDEMLANLSHLSLKDLVKIFDDSLNRVIDERVAAMDARNNKQSDNELPDLSGAGVTQELVGNIPTLKNGTPTQIVTQVIHDCPVVTLYDDNFNEIAGAPVFDVEHTRFKYVYFTSLTELEDGRISVKVAGSDDRDVGGINRMDYSQVETEYGMMGTTGYYEDAFGDEEVLGEYDPYAGQE